MKRVLLIVGGIVQVLIIALHVAMFFGLRATSQVPQDLKPLLYIFNAAVTTLVIFLAYVSFFRRSELLSTPLGRGVCWFVAAFYAQRGLTRLVVRGFDPPDLAIMLAIAAIYAIVALPARSRSVASLADGGRNVSASRSA